MQSVLLVEDRESLRRMLERALGEEGLGVVAVGDGRDALREIERRRFDLVLTDLKLPGASGLEIVAAVREAQPSTPVVVLTAFGTVRSAVEAMKLGAVDFLEKPVELDDLFSLVGSLLGSGDDALVFEAPGAPPIVGGHSRLRASLRLLQRVAPTESTVLLTGESGTGKELFARALHALSPRSGGPFVAVNCAAIPETLIENELFGHEKGAFTGAHRRQAGRFELAKGGTLFLDEIGELGSGVQGKVLRVLEERVFERVGGGTPLRADVRLVAATNRDLSAMVSGGAFRADLYFRLEIFPIHLPALRDRTSDLPHLTRHLLARLAERHGRPAPEVGPGVFGLLAAEPWPGNVRQLSNVLERLLILSPGHRIEEADLRAQLSPLEEPGDGEREELCEALRTAEGDKRAAAKLLGVSYRTVLRLVRAHDLEGYPSYRDR